MIAGQRPIVWFTSVALLVVLAAVAPLPAQSPPRPRKPSCKKIREAVYANHTWDQILREFDTDGEWVLKCTQKRGKRRAGPKAPKQKKEAKPSAKARPQPKSAAPKPSKGPRWTSGHPMGPRAVP